MAHRKQLRCSQEKKNLLYDLLKLNLMIAV